MNFLKTIYCAILLTLIWIQPTFAQDDDISTMSLEEVSRRMENPLSNLWSLTFQENIYINQGSMINGSDFSNVLFFQPFMPFPVGKDRILILRPVFPLVTQPLGNSYKTGIGDIQLITAFGPDRKNGTVWGVGATFKFPTATDPILGQGKWQAGPSAMIVFIGKPWTLGLVLQHWWSYAGDPERGEISQTDLQYIARRSFPGAWSVGMGPNISINWQAEPGNKLTLPIGIGITKTLRWGKVPLKMRIEPQYSIISPKDYGTQWNVRIQISPVINRPKFAQKRK